MDTENEGNIEFDCIAWATQEFKFQLTTFGAPLSITFLNILSQEMFEWLA